MAINIGIIAFNKVEELDLVGPWEVFQGANLLDKNFHSEVVSIDGRGVIASKGLSIGVHGPLDVNKSYDLLLVPGGQGTRSLVEDEHFLTSVHQLTKRATWITSVCTGAFIYAKLGLLKGKQCTTYHTLCDVLESTGSTGNVLRGSRFVVDGNTVTSAGVSAGIDMALWLVGQLKSPEFAREVQQYIEYFPEPPYAEVKS